MRRTAVVNIEGEGPFIVADYYDDRKRWSLRMKAGRISEFAPIEAEARGTPHGFAHEFSTTEQRHVVGYYSSSLIASGDAPDYSASLLVLVDSVVLEGDGTSLRQHQGALTRVFEAKSGEKWIATIEYDWPFYRELTARVFADPVRISDHRDRPFRQRDRRIRQRDRSFR